MRRAAFLALAIGFSPLAWADCPWTGTWVQRPTAKSPGTLSMTAEALGPGCKLTYSVVGKDTTKTPVATIDLAFDGRDVQTMSNGKPTGQTMALTVIDSRHYYTVMKYAGKQTGTVKSELSADGRTLKSEIVTTVDSPNGPVGKTVQYWDKR